MNYRILEARNARELEEHVNETLKDLHAGDETHSGEKWEVVGGPLIESGPNRSGYWFQAIRFVGMSDRGGCD